MEDDGSSSIIVKPRDYWDIAKLQDQTAWEEFLENPVTQTLEAITGAFALGVKQGPIAVGRIAQATIQGKMYKQVAEELRTLREAGRIPESLGDVKNGIYTWAELMRTIDEECPDDERLDALKALFYGVVKIGGEDWERIQAYQLWRLAKELNSGDLLVLRVIHDQMNRTPNPNWTTWMAHIATQSGIMYTELLERHEKRLIEVALLTPRFRVGGDGIGPDSGIHNTNNRLTQAGVRFCQNLQTYTIDLDAAKKAKRK
jgi:hypothetical protein